MLDCMTDLPLEITPAQVKSLIDRGESIHLIDVREPFEHDLAHLAQARLIPMRTVPHAVDTLRGVTDPIVVMCHHGVRSLQVVQWLREQGIAGCQSMSGGIDEWSREIDSTVRRY